MERNFINEMKPSDVFVMLKKPTVSMTNLYKNQIKEPWVHLTTGRIKERKRCNANERKEKLDRETSLNHSYRINFSWSFPCILH